MQFHTHTEKLTFEKVISNLPKLIEDECEGYDELFGYKLIPGSDHEQVKFYNEKYANAAVYKFFKACSFQYDATIKQLVNALNWRKEFKPWKAAYAETHDPRLINAGIITYQKDAAANSKVVTWNLYGILNHHKELFKDTDKFIRYRIGLMERGIQLLDLADDENNYITQVHDYDGLSLFTFDSNIKKCTKSIIALFQNYYPELLYAKYFVGVPRVLGWIYEIIKNFVSEETRSKFVVISDKTKLADYLKNIPKEFGGDLTETLIKKNFAEVKPFEYIRYLLEKDINDVE